MDVKVEPSAMY